MKNIVLYCSFFVLSLPLIGISQEKPVQSEDKGNVVVTGFARKKPVQSEDKDNVVVVAQKSDGPMLLYVINDRYYLGDTTNLLVRSLDVSKVRKIEEIRDKERREKHIRKTGKFSNQVREIFVIETDEKIDFSPVKAK